MSAATVVRPASHQRLLAVALILDSGGRSEAPKVAGAALQIVGDRMLRVNVDGLQWAGDAQGAGAGHDLNDAQCSRLAAIVEAGQIPAACPSGCANGPMGSDQSALVLQLLLPESWVNDSVRTNKAAVVSHSKIPHEARDRVQGDRSRYSAHAALRASAAGRSRHASSATSAATGTVTSRDRMPVARLPDNDEMRPAI